MPMPKGFHGPYILDEFTFLPTTDNGRARLRRIRDGKCVDCSTPSTTYRCPKHAVAQREYQRRHCGYVRRNLNAKSYRRERDVSTAEQTNQLPKL